jgi:hypothetical protein
MLVALFATIGIDARSESEAKNPKILHLQLIRPSKPNNILWRLVSTCTDVSLLTTSVVTACRAINEYAKTGLVNQGVALVNGKKQESQWVFYAGVSAYALGLLLLKRSYSQENSSYVAHVE